MRDYMEEDENRDVSQFGEYTFLKDYFNKNTPKYKCLVDAGANGVKLSNSYNFLNNYEWKGLLIEPNNSNYEELSGVYSIFPNVILVKAAVSDHEGAEKFYIHEVKGHHSLKYKTDRYTIVDVFRIQTLLKQNLIPLDFDYLTIDVEGMDYIVLKDMLEDNKKRAAIR